MSRGPLRLAITLFFLLSGATALVYQVIWVRMLGMVVGHSVLAIAVVVATTMAGLGLGARLAGGVARRSGRPLVGYGLLEAAIGLFALASPTLLHLVGAVPVVGTAQLLLGGLALLPPTLAMGATLPMLTAWYARDGASLGRDMGWLYAVNTTGAFVGAGLAGFALLPTFGQPATLVGAAAVNLAVGAGAIALGRVQPLAPRDAPAAPTAAAAPPVAAPPRALLAAFALSGGAAMVNQVAWNRGFSLFTGSTTYAFSLIVCAFIAGLAIGGYALSRVVDRVSDRAGLLAGLNVGIAASAAVLVPIIGELPLWLLEPLAARADSFAATQLFVFAVLFLLVWVPTLLMGGTYPVVTRALTDDPDEAPAQVGRAYAWNTVGAIIGSLSAGLLLIPTLGLRRTLWLAVSLNLLAAALLLARRRPVALVLPALGVAAMLAAPPWNPRHMNLAPHMYARDLVGDPARLAEFRDGGSVQFHQDGLGATVTVLQRASGAQVLRINGKTDASTEDDRLTQGFLGSLPLLLAEGNDDVLVIGLGSGMTLAGTLAFDTERVTVVELLPEVIDGAREFGGMLGDPLADPRVQIVQDDGRHLLVREPERYDVISSEPTNLFISGMSTMFTVEAFTTMRDRLEPGGVVLVWIQGYLLFDEDFRTVARTFQSVFPEAHLWSASPHDLVFTGHLQPLVLDADRISARLATPAAAQAAAWTGLSTYADLQRHYLMGPDALAALAGPGPLHTDADPFLEFTAPRALFAQDGLLDTRALMARRELLADDPALAARRDAARRIEAAALDGDLDALEAALVDDPHHAFGRERRARLRFERALRDARAGDLAAAHDSAMQVVTLAPGALPGWQLLAMIRAQSGDRDGAIAAHDAACRANPWSPYAHLNRGRFLASIGELPQAQAALDAALALDPALPEAAALQP